MSVSTVVIGANYGDEGKGLITDFETRRLGAEIVARFNGGAQAGHTVVDGVKRHVFGHHSSGTFAGAETYLGSRFIVNPFVLRDERAELISKGVKPIVRCHDHAMVTTIYDMILNGLAEIARGSKAHGSCGLGINETVTRSLAGSQFFVQASWLQYQGHIRSTLKNIKEQWVPHRMEELGITAALRETEEAESLFKLLDMPLEEHIQAMLGITLNLYPARHASGPVVFEGAQGLQLDEFMGVFPHVTRSMTGMPYAIQTAAELGVRELQPVYVTRTYNTRHGNGPLRNEGELPFEVKDKTNVKNRWQGQLRFAPLDVCALEGFIKRDLERAQVVAQMYNVKILPATLAITWMDVAESIPLIVDCSAGPSTTDIVLRTEELPAFIESEIGIKVSHTSHGPEHTDVKYISRA